MKHSRSNTMHHPICGLLAALTLPVSAITVTTSADENDNPAGPDISLREAIRDTPAAGTVDFDSALSGATFELPLGRLLLDKSINIDAGALAESPTLDGLGANSVLFVYLAATSTLDSLIFTNGYNTSGGGALTVRESSNVTVNDCQFLNNETAGRGGAIMIAVDGVVTLNHSRISHNIASSHGGGIDISGSGSSVILNDSLISNNTAADVHGDGGGIYASRGSVILRRTTVADNRASSGGGGVALVLGASLDAQNSTIAENRAKFGGGFDNTFGAITLESCTIARNEATVNGGGGTISNTFAEPVVISNTVVAGNTASSSPDLAMGANIDDLTLNGVNFIGDNRGCPDEFPAGNPNSNGDLVGAAGAPLNPGLSPLTGFGGPTPTMYPLSGGLLVDAGGATVLTIDQRGFPRVNGTVDIGAVETGSLLTVTTLDDENDGSLGAGTGDSLRECVSAAAGNGEIITFDPTLDGGTIALSGGSMFINGKSVHIDASNLDNGITQDAGNTSQHFTIFGAASLTIIGLDMINGSQIAATAKGGGISADNSDLNLIDLAMSDNSAAGATFARGGAVAWTQTSGSREFFCHGCSFTGNGVSGTGNNEGGALHLTSGLATIEDCLFDNNQVTTSGSESRGGAVFSSAGAQVTADRSTFRSNQISATTQSTGGAMHLEGISLIDQCTFDNNSALTTGGNSHGGAVCSELTDSALIIQSSTFTGNTAETGGGAIRSEGSLALTHATIAGNAVTIGDGGGISPGQGATNLENTIVAGNSAGGGNPDISAGAGLINDDGGNLIGDNASVATEFPAGPLVGTTASPVDPLLLPLGDYGGPIETRSLGYGSPAVDAAIASLGGPTTDQRGFSRENGNAPDIGAYESGNIVNYGVWAGESIPLSLDRSFAGDADGDRNANGLEYACLLNPMLPEPGVLTATLVPDGPGNTKMELEFPLRYEAPDIQYTIGRNTDLGVFSPRFSFTQFPNLGQAFDPDVSWDRFSQCVTDKDTDSAKGFWQLKVELLP